MEQTSTTPLPNRTPTLARLCVFSFINQGVMFPCYLIGIPLSLYLSRMDADTYQELVQGIYSKLFQGEQLELMIRNADMLRIHGAALMTVLAARTLARFIGTLRMWNLKADGFHIYTTAQLLGVFLPMLVAGTAMFSVLGLFIVLGWCYLYWAQMRLLSRVV